MRGNMQYHSENLNEIFTALSKAQSIMGGAFKDSNNPFYNSKYADLSAVWNACREPLSRNGLTVLQTTQFNDQGVLCLVTILGHSSGQWIKSELPIKVSENATEINKYGKEVKVNALQKLGSCLTYLRRYSLSAVTGVAPDEDDDGNRMNGEDITLKKEVAKPEPISASTTAKAYTKLSKEQADKLNKIISSDYKDDLLKYFGNKVGAKCIEDIPQVNFDAVYKAAVKRMEDEMNGQQFEVAQ